MKVLTALWPCVREYPCSISHQYGIFSARQAVGNPGPKPCNTCFHRPLWAPTITESGFPRQQTLR